MKAVPFANSAIQHPSGQAHQDFISCKLSCYILQTLPCNQYFF